MNDKEGKDDTESKYQKIIDELDALNALMGFLVLEKKGMKSDDQIWFLHKLGVSNEKISIVLGISKKTVANRISEKKK